MKILNSYNYSLLRSGKRTMMGEVEYEIDFLFDILLTQHCCFGFHKNRTSNMAGGHRHSLRRNVCRPATAVFSILYKSHLQNRPQITSQTKKELMITGSYINNIICEDILMRCAANKKRTGDFRFLYIHHNLRGIFDEKRLR